LRAYFEEVREDGVYKLTVKCSEDAIAESAFDGLSYMGIKRIRDLNNDTADIDISYQVNKSHLDKTALG